MRSYEKDKLTKRKKLKTYQKVILLALAFLFVVATIILCVMFKDYIFTENALAYTLLVLLLIVCFIGFIIFQVVSRK